MVDNRSSFWSDSSAGESLIRTFCMEMITLERYTSDLGLAGFKTLAGPGFYS